MNLPGSKHFHFSEVGKSVTAERAGIDNEPSVEDIQRATLLAINCLDPIRIHFGRAFSPNSWLRKEPLEKLICWHNASPGTGFPGWCHRRGIEANESNWSRYFARKSHPMAEAGDFEIPGVDNNVVYFWCKENLKFDQLIREFHREGDPASGWIHISYTERRENRQQAFAIPRSEKFT